MPDMQKSKHMKVGEETREKKKDKVNCKLQEKQKAIQAWEGHHSTPLWPGCKEHLWRWAGKHWL